jgi:flagellar biosynthesis protein
MSSDDRREPDVAIALHYDGENAPLVKAKGEGELARQIIQLAEEHGIPLHDDPDLAAILTQIPLGDEIPNSLYVAIAEVIAFAYIVSNKMPAGFQPAE